MPKHPQAPWVQVEVTQDIIRDSKARDSGHCMVAESIKVARPGVKNVSVDLQTIRFSEDGYRYTYLTPRVAQAALVKFDQGKEEPTAFAFKLRGGQVTYAGSTTKRALMRQRDTGKALTDAQLEQRKAARTQSPVGKRRKAAKLVQRDVGSVADRVGGKTPPLQPVANVDDGVPFTRRRAFGLRALEY